MTEGESRMTAFFTPGRGQVRGRFFAGGRVVLFDPLLDTFQFPRHEFVECA